jgi:hypothetical protein
VLASTSAGGCVVRAATLAARCGVAVLIGAAAIGTTAFGPQRAELVVWAHDAAPTFGVTGCSYGAAPTRFFTGCPDRAAPALAGADLSRRAVALDQATARRSLGEAATIFRADLARRAAVGPVAGEDTAVLITGADAKCAALEPRSRADIAAAPPRLPAMRGVARPTYSQLALGVEAAEAGSARPVLRTHRIRRTAPVCPDSSARPIAAKSGGACSVLLTSGARGTRRIDRIPWIAGIVRGTSG